MLIAIALCVLAPQEIPQKHLDAAAAIELPKDLDTWKEKGKEHEKAAGVIADRRNWARGLQLIDEKLGLFVAAPKIKVLVVEAGEPWPAKGRGRAGTGEVHFNIGRMAEYIRKVEDFERLRQYGKEVRFRVPPTPVESLVHHELTHCFAGRYDETWLTEGLASYVAGETAVLWDFQHRRAPLEALDREVAERDAYARGYCAVAWVADRCGVEKLKAFVGKAVADKAQARAALEEATGLSWPAIVTQERDWARTFLRRYTPDE